MNNELEVLVVIDNEGIMRPQAGIWKNNEAGKMSSEDYVKKNGKYGDTIIVAVLTKK